MIGLIKRLTEEELTGIINNYPEQDKIDFKKILVLKTDNNKAEFIKDVIAIANVPVHHQGYIIYGIDNDGNLVGIRDSYDDANLQQMVNSKLQHNVNFTYFEQDYLGKRIGVCAISEYQTRPLMLKQDYEILTKGTIYIRRGSSTDIATADEINKMVFLNHKQLKKIPDIAAEVRKRILSDQKMSNLIIEYYDFLTGLPSSDWIRNEVSFYNDGDLPQHRRVQGYFSVIDLEAYPFNLISMDKDSLNYYRQIRPDQFILLDNFILHQPLMQLENLIETAPSDKSIIKLTLPNRFIEKHFHKLPKFLIKSINNAYFYIEVHQIKHIIELTKANLLKALTQI